MQKEPLVVPNKSCKTYFLLQNGTKAYFSGNFDNGNLEKAQQLSSTTFRVTPGYDKTRNTTHRTFFHFKVQGFKACTIKFIVTRATLLEQFIRKQTKSDSYHPVVRKYPNQPFEKVTQDIQIYYNSMDEPELSFKFTFEQQNWVEFAFIYPHSYQDNEHLIHTLAGQLQDHQDIYFHLETLIKTSQTRKIHLVTITDKRNISKERMDPVQGIFGQGERPFKIDKPRVVISARVHPGEVPASHCMEGVLRFLVNQTDYRSYLLRKYFQFCLIPMVNPQGVFEGMFRNDLNGDNLNRMYLHCNRHKHKSIWGIQRWADSLDRVDFFFDLHAHPSKKGFFIYGNAFEEFIEQIQAQIFSKMLEYNCPYFQNLDCIYSEKAMNAKDRFDIHTKQGCARVFYHKKFNMIHSYTVECGYFYPTKLNRYPAQRQFITGSDYQCTQQWQKISSKQYTPQNYMFMGKALLISILDLFHVNPYSRISTSDFKSINSLRKFTAQRIYNEVQRFRLVDSNCYRKIKDIANMIEQHYYIPRFKIYGLTINQNYGMRRRKKAFSLNSRLYKQKDVKDRKGLWSQKSLQIKQSDHMRQSTDDHKEIEQNLIYKLDRENLVNTPSLPKIKLNLHKGLSSAHNRPKKVNSTSNLQRQKVDFIVSSQQNEQHVILHSRTPSDRRQEANFINKVEKQILNEVLRQKQKKVNKPLEHQKAVKVDRLQTFLKKQSTHKLPSINSIQD